MLALLLLLLMHHVAAEDAPVHGIVKSVASCPAVGYFFHQELAPNALEPSTCLLCFCRNNTSVCWKRSIRHCDSRSYTHYSKRGSRVRRSPGFADIFFRDATRDVMDRRAPEQCKPYESSFSEGCPPADWCIGCTVCDCDANGRWDCHILSFCPDKKGKKQVKKKKSSYKGVKRHSINTQKEIKKAPVIKGPPKKANIPNSPKKVFYKNTTRRSTSKKSIMTTKNVSQIKKTTKKMSKITAKKAAVPKVANKKISTKQALKQSYKVALQNVTDKNDTYKLAEAIVKKVMSNVARIMEENQKQIMKSVQPKVVEKRSMSRRVKETKKKVNVPIEEKPLRKPWIKKPRTNKPPINPLFHRSKRSVELLLDNATTIRVLENLSTVKVHLNETKVLLLDDYNTTTLSPPLTNYYNYKVHAAEDQIYNLTPEESTNIIPIVSLRPEPSNNETDSTHSNLIEAMPTGSYSLVTENNSNVSFMTVAVNINNLTVESNKTMKNDEEIKCGPICRCRHLFRNFVSSFQSNSSAKPKTKGVSLFNKIKNILNPLLKKVTLKSKENKQNRKHISVLKSLCTKFKLCKSDLNDKVLQSKLADLDLETNRILKIVTSLRGLLYLLNRTENNNIQGAKQFDTILRQLYAFNENETNITDTKRYQIRYVKQNTRDFITSLEKFAIALTDVIKILQKQNNKSIFHKDLKHAKNFERNQTIENKISKLKKLLRTYTVIQNKFMSKMYDALSSLQMKKHNLYQNSELNQRNTNMNNSTEIETYSKNIVGNLRKLRILGRKLNSYRRVRREAMGDDDAVEYLLMLMEYLLKQNKPPVDAQVKDGIDLLIDAIKNAPDIKPIKFNITFQTKRTPTRTTGSTERVYFKGQKWRKEKQYTVTESDVQSNPLEEPIRGFPERTSTKATEKYITRTTKVKVSEKNIGIKDMSDEQVEQMPVYINKHPENTDLYFNNDKQIEKFPKFRFEVYNSDNDDDEPEKEFTTLKPNKNKELKFVKSEIELEKENEKLVNVVNHETIVENSNINEKDLNLVWKESGEELNGTEVTTKVSVTSRAATRTVRRQTDKYASPISGISSEEVDAEAKKRFNEDSRLKEGDIFNSFDYNTERNDPESDSKEDKTDAFSYFV